MKLKNFALAFIFLSIFAVASARAQFDVFGTVTGRVVNSGGGGIRRAQVTIINLTTLETKTRLTNDFGYFKFNNLPILDLYLAAVASKRYSFTFSSRIVRFTDLEHNVIFTSDD